MSLRSTVSLLAVLASVPAWSGRAGYQEFPGVGYYHLGDYAESWVTARALCRLSGGELAIVNSQAEADVLQDLLTDCGHAYVGYHDLFTEGEYLTLFGVPLNETGYNIWSSGKPNGGANENCGSFSSDGGLYNVQCQKRLRYICEMEPWRAYEQVTNLGYYKLYLRADSWGNALRTCHRDGASLAVINSGNEYNTLQAILGRHLFVPTAQSDDVVFLGFHDIIVEGEYLTLSGEALSKTGYMQWNNGEPRNDTTKNCGALTRRGRLSMYNCNNVYAFFCEHPLL